MLKSYVKKLKCIFIFTMCMLLLASCGKDDDKDESKKEDGSKEWSVSNIYEGYKKDGNKITTVYGTVEFEDYTKLEARKSDMAVTKSSIESSESSLLKTVDMEEVNDEFISKHCVWKGINNKEEFEKYIHDLIYMLNAYNATWSDIMDKFTLTDYDKDVYNALTESMDAQYESYVKGYGYASLEEYCKAMNMTVENFRKQAYDIEGMIKERIINLVLAKENGLELNDENEKRVMENIAFQNGLTSIDEAKKQIGGTEEDWQLTVANYLVLEWIAENVKIVDDIEAEGAVVDQTAGPQAGDTVAVFTIKNFGTIKVRLFDKLAPKAVENFVTHAKEGYYDGLTFHRVIENFMIQGGDPKGDGTGGESIWKEAFEDEFSVQLIPVRGALCMANAGKNTNGSQFFIVQCKDVNETFAANWLEMGLSESLVNYYKANGGYPSLYKVHTVFGQVYEGMDVVDAIAGTETDDNDKPKTDVVVEKIEIQEYSAQ